MFRYCGNLLAKVHGETLPSLNRVKNILVRGSNAELIDFNKTNTVTSTTDVPPVTHHSMRVNSYEGGNGYQYHHERTKTLPSVYLVGLGILGFFQKKEEKEETIEDKILMTIKRAILAIQRDDHAKAERLLQKAFRMSDAEKLEDAKTQIIDIQANLHLQRGELVQAEQLFKLVAQRMVGLGKATAKDNSIVEISIKLAEIYKLSGRHAEAQSGFQYCIDTQKEKIQNEDEPDEDTLLLGAWALHGLAQLHIAAATAGRVQKQNIEMSLNLIQDAYKYAVTAVGSDSQQALAIQSDVATTYALLGELDNALKTVEQCADIAKDKYETLYATLRVNAGNLFLQKGDYVEAEKMCSEAKVVADRANDPESIARALDCVKRVGDLRKKQLKSGSKE